MASRVFEAGRAACLRNTPKALNPYVGDNAQSWERGWLSQHEWMMLDLKWRARDRCDHKFIDSKSCLKCGWTPSPSDFAALAQSPDKEQ